MVPRHVTPTFKGQPMFGPTSEQYRLAKAVRLRALAGMRWWQLSRTCPLCAVGRFEVDAKRNAWRCSECAGERKHGPIGYTMRRDLVSRDEAVRLLAGLEPMRTDLARLLFLILKRMSREATRLIQRT